jgi:hypothetical protein
LVEKIRISLWDVFSFFLTGLLGTLVITTFAVTCGGTTSAAILDASSKIPTAITLVAAPIIFTLFGMIIEPFANYFDQYCLKYIFGWALKPKEKHRSEEEILKEEIRSKYFGSLNNKISNPFSICKEYVETKQLSTTFMVYLARYGFYRNCAFISFASGIAALALAPSWCIGVISLLLALASSIIFKRRSEDFYSYMAPTVYRAFLIDKVSWTPEKQTQLPFKECSTSAAHKE